MILGQATLDTTVVTVYSVPANRVALPNALFVSNLTASDKTVSIYLVKAGELLATKHLIFSGVALLANECKMIVFPENTALIQNDSIRALASVASSVNLHVVGDETNV